MIRKLNALSAKHVLEAQEVHLVAISFSERNKFSDCKSNGFSVAGKRNSDGIIFAGRIQQMLFNIFSNQETDGKKEFTDILIDCLIMD